MHYVGSINIYEHQDGPARVSLKVFRVYDYGARPSRPVWQEVVTTAPPTGLTPKEWLQAVLELLTKQ